MNRFAGVVQRYLVQGTIAKDDAPGCLDGVRPGSRDWCVPWLDSIWERLFPAEQRHIARHLIEKVIVSPNDLEVRFRPNGIEILALELQPESVDKTIEEAVA